MGTIETYDKLLTIDPNHTGYLNMKGIGVSKLGNYTEAIGLYDIALAIDPNDKWALDNKDNVLSRLNLIN
jgi:tetratricopeptide (TPR) repeat protein